MSADSKALTDEVAEICWYMRGSISWDQAWQLNDHQKSRLIRLIKKKIENVEKTKMPLL